MQRILLVADELLIFRECKDDFAENENPEKGHQDNVNKAACSEMLGRRRSGYGQNWR